jgi:hypothetical protein
MKADAGGLRPAALQLVRESQLFHEATPANPVLTQQTPGLSPGLLPEAERDFASLSLGVNFS